MTPTITIYILSFACAALAAFIVGKYAFTKDTQAEARKRSAIKVSSMLTSMGLVRLPRVLEAYAVNDWSGLAKELHSFAELALNEKAVAEEFSGIFKSVLGKQLNIPEGRAMIAAMLKDAATPTDPSVVKAVSATATVG